MLTRLHSIKPGLGANTGGVSFDRAGNVYAVSDSDKRLGIWALPKVNNSFTTLAPSNMKIGIVFDKLEEIKDLADIVNIYPNPAGEFINIESKGISIEMLNLYDLNGQLLLNKQIAESKTQLTLTNLNPGIYILKIKTKSGTAIKRIVKN